MSRVKQVIKGVLGQFGYQIRRTRYIPRQLLDPKFIRWAEFDDVVCRRMFEFGSGLSFVQIGAFDGITKDPLRKYIETCGWRGVLVEPQRDAAEKLRKLYAGNDNIVVLQAALDREPGTKTLFTVISDDAPAWAGALASFNRDTIMRHSDLIPGLDGFIKEEVVDCIPFGKVLEYLPSACPDILQIDAEGADAYILSLFPLEHIRPAIVHWEVRHLSQCERQRCLDLLARFEYRFAPSGSQDMLAVLGDL